MTDRRLTESETRDDLIRRFAFNAYQIRLRCGLKGDEKSDFYDGEKMYNDYLNLNDMLDRRKI